MHPLFRWLHNFRNDIEIETYKENKEVRKIGISELKKWVEKNIDDLVEGTIKIIRNVKTIDENSRIISNYTMARLAFFIRKKEKLFKGNVRDFC